MESVKTLAEITNWSQACKALDVPGVSAYRFWRQKENPIPEKEPVKPERVLSVSDRELVLEVLNSDRFVDLAPSEVYPTLLDEDKYTCSIRTMYRILTESNEVRERRNQVRNFEYAKLELLTTRPNELWIWGITKLKGPMKWS